MGIVMRNILLCLMLGAGCSIYYETIVPVRVWRTAWVKYTAVPAFALGFLVIAFTEIPPYILQPVRVIAVRAVLRGHVDRDGHCRVGRIRTAAGVPWT